MSYFTFHLVFILPPILLLALVQRQPPVGIGGRRAGIAMLLIGLLALVYTTPWDNYLIWRGVWQYGSDRVVGTIGYVPVEEYLFFLLQSVLTGLWLYWLLANQSESAKSQYSALVKVFMLSFGLALSISGALMLQSNSTLYLGLVLVWSAPVLTLQWVVGATKLWMMKRAWLVGTFVPTLYLWITDRIAIGHGIWQISDMYTTGLQLFGLPIEEATFFLVTNLLVVQGLMLFLLLKIPQGIVKLIED